MYEHQYSLLKSIKQIMNLILLNIFFFHFLLHHPSRGFLRLYGQHIGTRVQLKPLQNLWSAEFKGPNLKITQDRT